MASHKILVIDDSRVIRMRVKEMLPPGNFEVLEAKDGIEGLNQIRQEHPNLIMLDFLLPKMSGWDVFQQIQTDGVLQSIPLVLMSGRKEEVTEKIPEPFEYFAFVEKPFEKKQLVDAIKEAMAKAKKRPVIAHPPKENIHRDESAGSISADVVETLSAKVEHLQAEVDGLKKQMAQLVTFIKQKIK